MILHGKMKTVQQMYLIDTNVISELRKQNNANRGVTNFMAEVKGSTAPCYLSVVTTGELKRGIEMIRHRGDNKQADACLLYTSPSPRDKRQSRMPSSA